MKSYTQLVLTGILTVAVFSLHAQGTKWKFERKMKRANDYYDYQDYYSALQLYRELYAQDTSDCELTFKMGASMFHLKDFKSAALPYFKKAARENCIEAYYYLGMANHLALQFEEALKAYKYYKTYTGEKSYTNAEVDRLMNITVNAIQLMGSPVQAVIKNLGSIVNSTYPDYVPLISADESVLIFTSRRAGSTGGLLDPYNEYFEDIYISYRQGDSQWSLPKGIDSSINSTTHDACVGLAANGERLFIYRTSENITSGDLYQTTFNGKNWTTPEKLSTTVNTEKYSEYSASISADEQVLYFTSDKPGGYGGRDIYRVVKLPTGEWSKALNLGPAINTPYDEDAPFIHPNDTLLYFSSKGHMTMGGYDIFKTSRLADGSWSAPQNIGYPINSVNDDIYFVRAANGLRAYFSSTTASSYGKTDIYVVNIPDENFMLAAVKGKIALSDSGEKNIDATLTLVEDASSKVQGVYRTNGFTGKYLLVMSPEKKYKLIVEAEGYIPYTENLFLPFEQCCQEIDKNIMLKKAR